MCTKKIKIKVQRKFSILEWCYEVESVGIGVDFLKCHMEILLGGMFSEITIKIFCLRSRMIPNQFLLVNVTYSKTS